MWWAEEQCDWFHFGSADMFGAMLALYLDSDTLAKIKIEDGEPEDQIHLTLVYFDDKAADRDDWDNLLDVVKITASNQKPLKGTIGGYGLFAQKEPVLWASVDVPGLSEFKHDLTEDAATAGFDENKTHGFTPHITLKYGWEGELPELKEPIEIEFKEVWFTRGEEREAVKLRGGEKTAMAERTGDPELDALIEQFATSWKEMRKPEYAEFQCQIISWEFVQFLRKNGIQASTDLLDKDRPYPEGEKIHDSPYTEEFSGLDELGYDDAQDTGFTHCVVYVDRPGGRFMVDFTAAQYGYSEFPMVQRVDDESGEWRREWTSKTAGQKWYHGTVHHQFSPGDFVTPANGGGFGQSNWTVWEDIKNRTLRSGRQIDKGDVVWIESDPEEARNWAERPTLKYHPSEIRALPGLFVYEVEPENLDFPVDPHTPGEACCDRARVIAEVTNQSYANEDCDYCGAPATVNVGGDLQLCEDCVPDAQRDGWEPSTS